MQTAAYYYRILGVDENASPEELKKAFRKKAMALHPDRNPAPDAHERFLELQEAYDFIKGYRLRIDSHVSNEAYYRYWEAIRREEARERARQYARMKYESYIQSEEFKAVSAVNSIFDLIGFFFILIFITGIPVILILRLGFTGILICLLLLALVFRPLFRFLRESIPDLSSVKESLKIVFRSATFRILALTAFNLLILFKIGLHTLLPLPLVLLSFFLPALLTRITARRFIRFKDEKHFVFTWLGLAPLITSVVFILNMLLGTPLPDERYRFRNKTQETYRGTRQTTTILLEDEKYSEYYFLRFFNDYSQMAEKQYIRYSFRKGVFGWKVMTDYEFE